MNNKYDKIKSSQHHTSATDAGRPGHDLSTEEAAGITKDLTSTTVQEDGRKRYWGYNLKEKLYRVVVSAAVSDGNNIGRIVTAYRDRPKNIGRED